MSEKVYTKAEIEFQKRLFVKQYQWRNGYTGKRRKHRWLWCLIRAALLILGLLLMLLPLMKG